MCNRLPCNERCTQLLKCGHRCPSLCGEVCPHNLCQECGDKGDARVDFLEWKTYSEISFNETPIIVLGCGHFFTSESVDGLVGLDEVYTKDKDGDFDGLRDVSSSLASVMPSCPDCKQPIGQFVTKRYNRVINRAVMDETCKRFLIKGHTELKSLELRLRDIEDNLNAKSAFLSTMDANLQLKEQNSVCQNLGTEASALSKAMEAQNQPMKRLMDAIVIYQKSSRSEIDSLSAQVKAANIATQKFDDQITLGARLIYIKSKEVILSHVFRVTAKLPRQQFIKAPSTLVQVLSDCRDLITRANEGNFSRIVIAATISFAKIAQLEAWYHRAHPEVTTSGQYPKEMPGIEKLEGRFQTTRDLLALSLKLCDNLGNCSELQQQVQEMARLYEGPRYETVTLEELQSIKTAMISGREGIATHSGHWYNCVNGHPVSNLPIPSDCPEFP